MLKMPQEWAQEKSVPGFLLEMAMRKNNWQTNLGITEKAFDDAIAAVSDTIAAPEPTAKKKEG